MTAILRTLVLIIALTATVTAGAIPRAIDSRIDTLAIANFMADAAQAPDNGRREHIGRLLLDLPYGAGTLEGDDERLRVNLDTLDCTTFVDIVAAADRCVADRRLAWRDFLTMLADMRYRRGQIDGYASRLHYISMWAVDNIARGNITEVTSTLPGATTADKTLDFMTTHRDAYPALADPDTYARMRDLESGYRNHRFSYVPTSRVTPQTLAKLRAGDIVAFTTRTAGLDVAHIGIIANVDGQPHLLHASSRAGRVILEPRPLDTYLRHNRNLTGIRVFR